jgi:hypothetical protein
VIVSLANDVLFEMMLAVDVGSTVNGCMIRRRFVFHPKGD